MKSFIGSTRAFWQTRLNAVNSEIRFQLRLCNAVRQIGSRQPNALKENQRILVQLRAARVPILVSLHELRAAA